MCKSIFVTPEWSKQARKVMIDKDMTIKQLSTEIGFARQYVSSVMTGRIISQKVQKAVCNYLNLK